MLLGCIADDFTGASDLANTLAREGMRTRMVIGNNQIVGGEDEAIVVALKTRSIAPADAVAQSLAALDRLRAAGCRQFFFKYCSTFDSTPAGNIGPVAQALATALGVAQGVVVCPAFPGTGRTVYQGHLFVGDRLLSESGMERHPLTPMTDPDIRRWLAKQTGQAPGHVPHAVVRDGSSAIADALDTCDQQLVIVDAISNGDLRTIGAAARHAPLVTGGSGVAIGLPDNFRQAGLLREVEAQKRVFDGPAVVISGSCSTATRAQVHRYASSHPTYAVDVDRLLGGVPVEDEALAFVMGNRDKAPLVYSSDSPDAVAAAQAKHGSGSAAGAIEALFGRLASAFAMAGFGRIVVAGGETSGAVVEALRIGSLAIGAEIDPGVPALSGVGPIGAHIGLALKSGNFGREDFFERAIRILGGDDE